MENIDEDEKTNSYERKEYLEYEGTGQTQGPRHRIFHPVSIGCSKRSSFLENFSPSK